ncbi:MAG TPA: PEP-CTERM sorting domain-containing protein [Acidobacteriaceae bacterium]
MSRTASVLCALVLAAIATTAAKASTIFNFSYSGTSNSASGQFTADVVDATTFVITGITGITDGSAITSLLAPNTFGGNDNLITVPSPSLDLNGVSYTLANGDLVNLYDFFGTGAASVRLPNNQTNADTGTLVVTAAVSSAAPEPSGLILLGTGLLSIMAVAKCRPANTPQAPTLG